jgi:hypothetical protein
LNIALKVKIAWRNTAVPLYIISDAIIIQEIEFIVLQLFAYSVQAALVAGNHFFSQFEVPASHFRPSPEGGESSLRSYISSF